MLGIPSCVCKVFRFHYSLSRFAPAVAVFLHGGPRVRGELCGLVSPGVGGASSGEGAAVALLDTHMGYTCSFKAIARLLAACYH